MLRSLLSLIALPVVSLVAACQPAAPVSSGPPITPPDTPLGLQLGRARSSGRLPAVAGVRVTANGEVQAHAFGLRRADQTELVTSDDHFHLGSNSKAITASLLGALVDDGAIAWDLTIGASFPDIAARMTPAWRAVTLRQLLTHRAGMAPFTSPEEILGMPDAVRRGSPAAQRQAFAAWLLQRPMPGTVGQFEYSNAGYGIAMAMAERVTGRSFEQLLQERLFDRLGIPASAVRIGWPALQGSAPWGHVEAGRGWTPHDPTDDRIIAIPAALAPAGDLSMTMAGYARFLQMHLRGLAGQDDVLRAATIRQLHQPDGDYAFGWGIQEDASGIAHFHEGSAGTFHMVTVLIPRRGVAVATVTNAGGDDAADAIRSALAAALR
jgi:CubicO group peptidase (beta-lactamase class C family)